MISNEELSQLEDYARERAIPVIIGDGRDALVSIVQRSQPTRILEVGCAIGYSGSIMLNYASPCATLDTIELDSDRAAIAESVFHQFRLSDRVRIMCGNADDILPQLVNENIYDFVFIDAAKAQYLKYYQMILPSMSSGGVMVADNVHFRGMVNSLDAPCRKYRTIVVNMRKFIDYIMHDERVSVEILSTGDGIAIITKI